MGLHFKGGSIQYRTIRDNLSNLPKKFELKKGYFGTVGSDYYIREIYSDNPFIDAEELYEHLTYGSTKEKLPNGTSTLAKLADGTIIVYRNTTKSLNYPAIDINITRSNEHGELKNQKIHFKMKGEK